MRPTTTLLALAATALAVSLAGAAPATAAPPDTVGTPRTTGCPAGQLLSVAELEAQGPYQLPRSLDQAGNQDGYVCGQPLAAAAAARLVCGGPCDVPVYSFDDNDLPAARP